MTKNWTEMLHKQAQRIGRDNYQPDLNLFTGAPDDILLLSGDLSKLALEMRERDHIQHVLSNEVHHRVKNNLQIVTSLLSMQVGNIEDPSARAALSQTQARMGALALIHRMLYENADEGALGRIDIARLMSELCTQVRAMNHNSAHIDISCAMGEQKVPADSVVPLTLFAVEAITNSYRHAFPDGRGGVVQVTFTLRDDTAVLMVSDDGVGYDAGSAFKSMGRQLMTAFAHQLGGAMEIESTPASGTNVTLTFPMAADVG